MPLPRKPRLDERGESIGRDPPSRMTGPAL